jgi:hypothetical protein
MIDIKIPNKDWITLKRTRPQDRKFLLLAHGRPELTFFAILKEEMHIWMISNNIEYDLFRKDSECFISFNNKNNAMLFKLTWFI